MAPPATEEKALAGFRQFGFRFGWGLRLIRCGGCLDGRENQGCGALNHFQAFGEECGVAVVQVDVVGVMLSST